MSYDILTLAAYRAIGLKWEGTFSEIVPNLKNVIQQMEDRADELEHKINSNIQLGLSYHTIENGFVHYAVYEVSEEQEIPDGMMEIKVPEWTYVKTTHNKGEDIQKTYQDLHQWLFDSDYTVIREDGVDYYDPYMPIKHEHYPVDRDPNDPHFDIYIPIVKK
ncbi:GyrI-like domain-containing protein [Halalkalibacterium halodurans]|uniref:GyrI-like domain-containing protein n=2 Tax=Halalkalibacterium halodurans TaxID=86665 RepID=UPI002E20C596|nr:GyrI-like domain-containing protein [Halalkalibacterium halodurans]MED4085740.1 GyrI-like domain-containing protein [Halalkalibacterium halodurans]MED4106445.1 GyrI-like domain-containing protein [Halalkalibacterium halodurans]MED4108257.1 GyrI-like domain-containing protein [Halalkalibacterium halodurans]MED4151157.1 GyrI-like domain-containing protein [Halalkalibacterium halodurans]